MNFDCKKCNKSVRVGGTVACSGSCGSLYHPKCIGADYLLKSIETNELVCVLCGECKNALKSLNENIKTVRESVKGMDMELKVQSATINEIKEVLEQIGTKKEQNRCVHNLIKERMPTYAEKLKEIKKAEPKIILKPKKGQDALITKNEMIEKINPEGIQVSKMKMQRNGCVVVACEDNASVSKLKANIEREMSEKYEVQLPKERNFRLKILGLPKKLSGESLMQKIKDKNSFLENEEISFKVIYETKDKNKIVKYNAIFEVQVNAYKKILELGTLRVDWGKYRVLESFFVRRCYNCLGFNHKSTECKRTQACSHCGEEHKSSGCSKLNDIPKCINCSSANQKYGLNLKKKMKIITLLTIVVNSLKERSILKKRNYISNQPPSSGANT